MSFRLTVLGSSGTYATAYRAASGYLVELHGYTLWIDAGGGTWQHLLKHVDYADVDGILLTHRHPDHTSDVFQAFHARLYGPRQVPNIPLWAPQETLDRITGFSPEMSDTFDLQRIRGGDALDIGGAKVTFFEMAHPAETCGLRLEYDGAVLAYSADTGPAADLHSLANAADLFICESTFQESDAPWWEGHLSASQAGAAAAAAEVAQLLLTHLPPNRDLELTLAEARKTAGSVPVELAEDRHGIEVGS